MKIYLHLTGALILGFILASCSEDQSSNTVETRSSETVVENTATGESATTESNSEPVEKFTPQYIYAEDLKVALDSSDPPYVFDVRSEPSFQKSHILSALSMPYGNTDEERLASQGISKQSQIVAYCGCPRHLSTLSAEALGKMGYENVSVLYEGYWHWKDNGFPIVDNEAAATITTLRFEGRLTRAGQSADDSDIFLRHQRTGQLEATRTASDGGFAVDFHLYDYYEGDQFEIILGRLDNQPVLRVAAASKQKTQLQLNL